METRKPGVAIVTGGAQGIGTEIARALSRDGFAVAIVDIKLEAGAACAKQILEATGQPCQAFQADISDATAVAAVIADIEDKLGPIEVLVNNAAIFTTLNRKPFETIALDEWDLVMRVNINGPFNMAKEAVLRMKPRSRGRIINISSNTVELGRPGFLHYVTSKSALVGMTRSMARELGTSRITVNAIMPTLIRTEVTAETISQQVFDDMVRLQCIPRSGQPTDVAETIAFLASDKAEFITGQTIAVDGGAVFL